MKFRDLWPQASYSEYIYDFDKGVVPYEDFVEHSTSYEQSRASHNQPRNKHELHLRVMKRGRDDKVDAFLDTLVS
jgi:hypothetical protein